MTVIPTAVSSARIHERVTEQHDKDDCPFLVAEATMNGGMERFRQVLSSCFFFRTFCFLCYPILRHPLCAVLHAIRLKLLVRWYVRQDAASIFSK